MDIICSRCLEPWDVLHVLHEEPEKFKMTGCLILECPCCEENLKYQNEELSDVEKEKIKERCEAVRTVCELLGDDIDGAASYLLSFGLI